MADENNALQGLDEELDAMVPRHIAITPEGHIIHGYSDDEAAGVLYALAEYLHDRYVQALHDQDEEDEE
jgi:hypothetical protein